MAAPSQFKLPIAIGAIWRDIFAWWVLICGKDSAGNPQPIKVGADGSLNTGGFGLPAYDYVSTAYVGSTNNPDTITYKTGGSSGTTVATFTFTYVGGAPASDNANVATITKS